MIMLSRNSPVAYVAGAAGFIGSHLTDKLLEKGIQVVGVDDFSSGLRENLEEATKDKNFHLVRQSMAETLDFTLPRLDYAFFILPEDISTPVYRASLDNFLDFVGKYSAKIVLVSSIDLYDSHHKGNLHNLKLAEEKVANFSMDNKANARVVRLAGVFGPRMHFRHGDPIYRLIEAASQGSLQKEATPLDFTTRSLFIDDAVSLLIKAIMHGATAQKIYDGALLHPIKVAEIKQVLLDPLWHERKGFDPTELPPWPTPNILKTEKELVWRPKTPVVRALRETIVYFQNHPGLVGKIEDQRKVEEPVIKYKSEAAEPQKMGEDEKPKRKIGIDQTMFLKIKRHTYFWVAVILFTWAFLYPFASLALGGLEFRASLLGSSKAVLASDFEKAERDAKTSQEKALSLKEMWGNLTLIKLAGSVRPEILMGEKFIELLGDVASAQADSVSGAKLLAEGMKAVSGEGEGDSGQLFTQAAFKFNQVVRQLSLVQGQLDGSIPGNLPSQLKGYSEGFRVGINSSLQAALVSEQASSVMAQMVKGEGKKEYLVILVDNNTLRPSGGVARAYGKLSFDGGKLSSIKVDEVGKLDKNFSEVVNPPAELKSDLGVTSWTLKDFATDLDFPASAKMAQWFFQKEAGSRVNGVIVLDASAVSKLAEVLKSEEGISLSGKLASSKEGDKLSSLALEDILKKIFFLSRQNRPEVGEALLSSFLEKHLIMFPVDQALFSYLTSAGWSGVVERQDKEAEGERNEFLALSEANMSVNPGNASLQRSLSLISNIDQAGWVSHKLTVDYSNLDSSGSLLNGTYRNRLKVYLPAGTKVNKALWGEKDITKDLKSFSDYGRAGYSMFLELKPKEQKKLTLEYQDASALTWEENKMKFKLLVNKQPGTGPDKLDVKINFPFGWRVDNNPAEVGEVTYSTDLSQNRIFEVSFIK